MIASRTPRRLRPFARSLVVLVALVGAGCYASTPVTRTHEDASVSDAATFDAGSTCGASGPPGVDPSAFASCAPACGGAHCVPDLDVPADARSTFAPCTASSGAGRCVPDPVIAAGASYVPRSCAPIPGTPAEGRCVSVCVPAAANASAAVVDVCAADERCLPCFDPVTGADTGVCSSAVCDAPVAMPYVFASCCTTAAGASQGRCLPSAALPTDAQAQLQQLTCPSASLCVPDEYVTGSGVSVASCGSAASPGTCVSRCVSGVPSFLPQGSCPIDHACVPCGLVPAGTPGCP